MISNATILLPEGMTEEERKILSKKLENDELPEIDIKIPSDIPEAVRERIVNSFLLEARKTMGRMPIALKTTTTTTTTTTT